MKAKRRGTLEIDRVRRPNRHRMDCDCYSCQPVEARLWPRVEKTADCWLWQGATNPSGYGLLTYDGALTLAHRVAWILTNGRIPDGLKVLHRCDTPLCCNPGHLFLGTQLDNVRDMLAKGRASLPKNIGLGACSKGHPHTPENTYTYVRRGRTCNNCRVCRREWVAARKAR